MGIEIASSRFLTPFFGSSLYAWASLVIVVMSCTSIGYYLGGVRVGRCSDKKQPYIFLLGTGLYLIVFPLWALRCVGIFLPLMTINSLSVFFVSMIVALILVGVPFVMLGVVIPYIIEFISPDVESLGRATGRIAAVAVMGGIVGMFVSTFWTLPFHGTRWTILFFGVLLIITAGVDLSIEQFSKRVK